MENNDSSRRDFLVAGLATALAAAGCNAKKNPFDGYAGDGVQASGEKVKLLSVDGEVIEIDKAFLKPVPDLPRVSNSEERKGIEGKKFVMVIDLSRCKNVGACKTACNHAHQLNPGQNWIKVLSMQDADSSRSGKLLLSAHLHLPTE